MSTAGPSVDAEALSARYDALIDVSSAISSYAQLPDLLHSLRGHLDRLVRSEFLAVSLHDPDTNTTRLIFLETDQIEDVGIGVSISLDGSYQGLVVRSGQPVYVPRVRADGPVPSQRLVEHGILTFCSVPLTTARRTVGTLSFGSRDEDAYSPDDVELMTRIGRLVAVAVENAMSFEALHEHQIALKRERDQLDVLLDVTNAVVTQLDTRALFQAVSPALRRCVSADVASLMLFDPAAGVLRKHACDVPTSFTPPPVAVAYPLDTTASGLVFRTREPHIFTAAELQSFQDSARIVDRGIQSVCSVPLQTAQGVLGTLDVGAFAADAFSPDQFELLTRVAGQIAIAVSNAVSYERIEELNAQLSQQKLYLEDEIRSERLFEDIIGRSPALRRVLREVETVAPTDSTVLITGDTGTGKELIARAIHQLSTRREHTFVKLNCAAIPTGLLESELFGHEKGAFTGAITQRIGRFELAHRGTVFLDEVGEIPLELQPKLLRVLQEREFERLGSARTLRTDARLIAATNRDLATLVDEQQFRQDLFYRLNVFPIQVPALRERREDIPMLVRHFAQQFARRMKKSIETIPTETMTRLTNYDWPGNIRELQNLIERAVILSSTTTLDVPVGAIGEAKIQTPSASPTTLNDVERQHILTVLEGTNWVVSGSNGAAARLGMNRSTLQFRMRKLGIQRPGR